MSNLEQLLFERLQRWQAARRGNSAASNDPWYIAVLDHRLGVARQDWQAAHEREGARNGAA